MKKITSRIVAVIVAMFFTFVAFDVQPAAAAYEKGGISTSAKQKNVVKKTKKATKTKKAKKSKKGKKAKKATRY